MSDWVTGVVAALLADNTLKALVSTRVYPQPLQHDATIPCVTWSVPTEVFETSASRAVCETRSTFYAHCWGETESSVRAVANAVKAVLLGYTTGMHGLFNIRAIGLYEAEPEIRRIIVAGDYVM